MPNSESQNRAWNDGGQTPPRSRVHPAEDDSLWMNYLAGSLSGDEMNLVEQHLASCPQCLARSRAWRQLEAQLTAGLKRPALSPSFAARLRQRIESEPTPAVGRARAPGRDQVEAELQASWFEYRKRFLRAELPALLDTLGYSVAGAVGSYFLVRLIAAWLNAAGNTANGSLGYLAFPLAAAAVILLGGLGFAARAQIARWLAEF
jgi:anti-sigma factor RsiW